MTVAGDLLYQIGRNSLIPTAELVADRVAGKRPNKYATHREHEEWSTLWNVTFLTEMDRLWVEHLSHMEGGE